MSQEYIGSLAIVLISILKMFGVSLASEEAITIITGVVALWVAVRRYQKRDITLGGFRKRD